MSVIYTGTFIACESLQHEFQYNADGVMYFNPVLDYKLIIMQPGYDHTVIGFQR